METVQQKSDLQHRNTFILLVVFCFIFAGVYFKDSFNDLLWWIFGTGLMLFSFIVYRYLNTKERIFKEKELRILRLEKLNDAHLRLAKALAEGDLIEMDAVEEGDEIGSSLLEVSQNIKKSADNEKIRTWQISGLNELGDIVRTVQDPEDNFKRIIGFLVKYLKANQGGLFIVNDDARDHHFIELKACYAYDKQKTQQKKIELKEGLLGQCFLERDIIYMERIPQNYVSITSGLGFATPSSLIIVPLLQGDEVYGMVELASFEPINEYQREFLKKAAEIIGGCIAGFKTSAYTSRMLTESQQLTQELRAQEEEMRQNLEEMEAIQEQISREAQEKEKLQLEVNKSKEFLNLVLDSVPIPVFVKDREHKMILLNKAVCDLNNLSREQMLGKSDYDFFKKEEADVFWSFEEEIFNEMKIAEQVEYAVRNGKETYTLDKKLAIQTDDGECFLVGINLDVTEEKMREKEELQDEKVDK